MNNENNQQPNKSAAALAFATMLSENLMKQQNPMQTEENPIQEEAPREESLDLETEEAPEAKEMEQGLDLEDYKKDMEEMMDKKLDAVKNELIGVIKGTNQ